MGRLSRTKGKVGERELAAFLRDYGYTAARRGQQYAGGNQSPDVVGIPGVHIECKRCESGSLYSWLDQAIIEAGIGEIPVVMHRKSKRGWVGILKLEDLMTLIAHARNGVPQ